MSAAAAPGLDRLPGDGHPRASACSRAMAAGSHRREPAFLLHAVRDRRAAAQRRASTAGGCWKAATASPGAADDGRLGGLLHAARHGRDAPLDAAALRARARGRATLTRARLALLACASLTVPLVIVVRRALGEHGRPLRAGRRLGGDVRARAAAHGRRSCAATRSSPTARRRCASSWPKRACTGARRSVSLADQELLRCGLRRRRATARVQYVSPSVARTLGL